jgi:hypothetical protein
VSHIRERKIRDNNGRTSAPLSHTGSEDGDHRFLAQVQVRKAVHGLGWLSWLAVLVGCLGWLSCGGVCGRVFVVVGGCGSFFRLGSFFFRNQRVSRLLPEQKGPSHLVVEYDVDDGLDMFQIGRLANQNDMVVPGPTVLQPRRFFTVSRYAARVVCHREHPYKVQPSCPIVGRRRSRSRLVSRCILP